MLCLLFSCTRGEVVPRGESETCVPHTGSTRKEGLDAVSVALITDGVQNDASDLRVTIVDHLQAVSPTGPVSCEPQLDRAAKAQAAGRQWK